MRLSEWVKLGTICFLIGFIFSYGTLAYSAPKKWNTVEGTQIPKIKSLLEQVDNIQDIKDVRIYLKKLTKIIGKIDE